MAFLAPTILIADDDRRLVEVLAIRLHAAGYHVITCMDGDDTIEAVRGTKPDVILMDVNMPGESGPDAQQALETFEDIDGIPIIYITGESSEEIKRINDSLKPFAILRKPFEVDELIDTIKSTLEC